jgi:formylglycine-generating enzyme required for sulfatase activity
MTELRACEDKGGGRHPLGCLLFMPGGTFWLGAQATDPQGPNYDPAAQPDEGPPRQVTLAPFWFEFMEVARAQFTECIRAGTCREADVENKPGYFNYPYPDRHLHPINGVTWFGARDYCAWIHGRLPTEAEWERVARGGTSNRYPWGNEPPTCDRAIMSEAGKPRGCGRDKTTEVTIFPKSWKIGEIPHLAGNVWEWTSDWYDEKPSPVTLNPHGPEKGERRVQRGGAWTSTDPSELRTAYRAALEPGAKMDDVGFRCVADVSALPAPQ